MTFREEDSSQTLQTSVNQEARDTKRLDIILTMEIDFSMITKESMSPIILKQLELLNRTSTLPGMLSSPKEMKLFLNK